MAKSKKRFIVFHDGSKKEITGETGKYWICDSAQYRKMNSDIAEVVEEKVPAQKDQKQEKASRSKKESEAKEYEPIPEFEEGFDNLPDPSEID